jgi:CRP-like cAMP-binding protein
MLAEDAQEELLSLGRAREFLSGDVLMLEGDEASYVMVLTSGWAKVTGSTTEGGQALLTLRVAGELVGEQAALDGESRSATVISAGPTSAREISQREFLAFLSRRPEAVVAVSRALSAQLRWATQRRIDLGGLPVIMRLARVLSDLGALYGRKTPAGIEFQYMLTQPELAAMVSASEPAVHRALRQLRARGVVATGYRQVVITDPDTLQTIASAR